MKLFFIWPTLAGACTCLISLALADEAQPSPVEKVVALSKAMKSNRNDLKVAVQRYMGDKDRRSSMLAVAMGIVVRDYSDAMMEVLKMDNDTFRKASGNYISLRKDAVESIVAMTKNVNGKVLVTDGLQYAQEVSISGIVQTIVVVLNNEFDLFKNLADSAADGSKEKRKFLEQLVSIKKAANLIDERALPNFDEAEKANIKMLLTPLLAKAVDVKTHFWTAKKIGWLSAILVGMGLITTGALVAFNSAGQKAGSNSASTSVQRQQSNTIQNVKPM